MLIRPTIHKSNLDKHSKFQWNHWWRNRYLTFPIALKPAHVAVPNFPQTQNYDTKGLAQCVDLPVVHASLCLTKKKVKHDLSHSLQHACRMFTEKSAQNHLWAKKHYKPCTSWLLSSNALNTSYRTPRKRWAHHLIRIRASHHTWTDKLILRWANQTLNYKYHTFLFWPPPLQTYNQKKS